MLFALPKTIASLIELSGAIVLIASEEVKSESQTEWCQFYLSLFVRDIAEIIQWVEKKT